MTQLAQRHPALPQGISQQDLQLWFERNAVEQFTDEQKRIFSPEEITEFEHESSVNGREVNRLEDLVKEIQAHVKKGSPEPLKIIVPPTQGTKKLVDFRRQNDDFIERGYETQEMKIYGIPDVETHNMLFFNEDGNLIPERTRALSAKEKHNHLGFFQNQKRDTETGNIVDESSGEILNTGTQG